MRILIFMASPHKNNNTGNMVKEFISVFHNDEYKIINVYDKHISPCVDCGFCKASSGTCSIHDDMEEIYEEINISDAIVLASPMYFSSFPGPMKNIIDRCQLYWNLPARTKETRRINNKKGILLLNGGTKWDNMFIHMESMGKYFFKTIGAQFAGSVYAPLTDEIPVSSNDEVISSIRILSQNLFNSLCDSI